MASRRVIVVGTGPAGVRAAELLVAAGLRPTVIDEAAAAGGQIYRRQPGNFRRLYRELYGDEADKAAAIHRTIDGLSASIDYRPETLAWNVADGVLHVVTGNRAAGLPFDALIIASGATDRVMPVPGWTQPGVYTLGAAQIALKAQACAIGAKIVFMGTGPLLYLVAFQYVKAGAEIVAVLDTSPLATRLGALPALASRPSILAKGLRYTLRLRRHGVRMMSGITPLAIDGTPQDGVSAVRVRDAGGHEHVIACDAVGLGYHLRSETQLADLARCNFTFDVVSRQWLPEIDAQGRSSVPGVYLAGDGARVLGADAAEISGALAAHAALADLHLPVAQDEVERLLRRQQRMDRFRRGLAAAFPWPARFAAALPDETMVCRCEAITAGELRRAAGERGAPEVNRAKAFTRVGMGRCQGRYCGQAGAEILAAALAVPIEQVGRLRGQAPVKPLPVAAELEPT
jgi:NADPH-dependent 2,4-dienoyl-CoA reductase/sulfur reductase-like enzyme